MLGIREIDDGNFRGRQVYEAMDSSTASSGQAAAGGLGGLVNMGLTCYANATFQAVRAASARIPWLLEEGRYNTLFEKDPSKERTKNQQAVAVAAAEVIQMLGKCKRGQSVRPGKFWSKVIPAVQDTMYEHLASKAPHDSHEFFLFLLECLHESTAQQVEMKIIRPDPVTDAERQIIGALQSWQREFSKEYSPFVDMFYGLGHWRTTCQECGNVSHRWESFNSMKVTMPPGGVGQEPPSLASLLLKEMEPETIEGYTCDACKKSVSVKRSFRVWRLPQVLLIVLKRFTPDGRKIHTRVAPIAAAVPAEFSGLFSAESPERTGLTRYTLRSIVDHHGSAGFGHYTAQANPSKGDGWKLYDDEGVRDLPGGPEFGESTYMLFFERT
jgi:ubiquitin C-terminal hydrolase